MGSSNSAPAPAPAPDVPVPAPSRKRKRVGAGAVRKKKKRIPKALRAAVWIQRFGDAATLCPVCETQTITPFSFECGHIVSERDHGPTELGNLMPVCRTCNASMSTCNLFAFRLQHFGG